MARKRRTRSENAKRLNDFLRRNKAVIAALAITALAVAAAAFWLNDFLCSAPYFDVKKIEIAKAGSLYPQKEYFSLEYPVNFFTADPVALSRRIKQAHPEYQIVIITKSLPNRIVATIKNREAVARIKVGKVLPVDFDGVIVSETANVETLPLITGLESQLTDPKAGTKVKSKRLSVALDILGQIYSRREFSKSRVETVNMTYPAKAFFVMDGMTVTIGNTDFERKLDLLTEALGNPDVDRSRIDSVDLRFTDAAVTFKSGKK